MSYAHTPGPWRVAEACATKYQQTSMRRIRSEKEGMEHGAVCEVYGIADGSEAAANARLIASAPELLGALERLHRWTQAASPACEFAGDHPIAVARAAITKATGETPC